jgi:alpha-L-rhamnosidase
MITHPTQPITRCIKRRQASLVGCGVILMLFSGIPLGHGGENTLSVSNLRCEYRIDPVGLDVIQPRLSWILHSQERGQKQSAYQILVASSPGGLERRNADLWDSGKVTSDENSHVPYKGKPLTSHSRAWWQVRVWDKNGFSTGWSVPARWEMGLVKSSDWQALWIADPFSMTNSGSGASGALPATALRKEFNVSKPIRRAVAYATALGLYELRLNGQRVGEQLLAPEWTSYRKRVQYQTYDVTDLVHTGANAIGVWLGEGWYAGRLMAVGRFGYGTYPRLLLQLELEFADDTRQTLASDDSWRSSIGGPIGAAGIYDGETYDASRELPGWDRPGYNDKAWMPVKALARDSRQLVWQRNEPISVQLELPCLSVTEPKPGQYVLDFGQNMVGWTRFSGQGTRGNPITFRHGEMLNEDGTLYTSNLRGAAQEDRYLPGRDGNFTFEPHFTYHGFRFVGITGLASPPTTNAAVGRVFHSAARQVGRFECSDRSLNQLMRNVLWTERGNLMSSPNDCPQRDERFGWMGDIQVFGQTAVFNLDLAAFFSKWTQDIRDDQAEDGRFPDFAPHPGDPNKQFSGVPAWGDAGVIVPWCAYQNYGDLDLLSANFESARRWVDYIHQINPDLIWQRGRNNDYNDWLNGDWIKQTGWPTNGASVPNELFATAFFAHSTDLVARMAEVLRRSELAKQYRGLFEQIKAAFNRKFVRPDGRLEADTQGGYALALSFDLLPAQLRGFAAQHLVEGIHRYGDHLSTGIQTTHRALLELTRCGHEDLAWQLVTNRTFPSWLYMIDNGATTIWERWDGYVKGRGFQDPGMNSFNHWAFGAVGEWIWRHVAGLNPDEQRPGWKHFFVAPKPGGGVTWAKGEFDSIYGEIESSWRLDGNRFVLSLVIPVNTTATVVIPATKAAGITENGRPMDQADGVRLLRFEKNRAVFEVESGRYQFASMVTTGP